MIFILIFQLACIKNAFAACSSGYYPVGNNCYACPDGHYCPFNQQPIPCPAGTVSWSSVSYRTDCAKCSDGYYIDEEGQINCKPCPDGHFCLQKTKAVKCPRGFVSWSSVSYRTDCARCSSGYYNDIEGSAACNKCPDGHFCPTSDVAIPCPAGSVSWSSVSYRTDCAKCGSGTYSELSGGSVCKSCPAGHFCPTAHLKPIPCPAGTVSWSSVSDRTDCAKCGSGYYNDLEGEASCKACPIGHFCPTAHLKPIPCPAGTVSWSSISDRTDCAKCSSGYYNDKEGQTSCIKCPAGYSCSSLVCPKPCSVGSTSSAGSTSCYACSTCNITLPSICSIGVCDPGSFYSNTFCKSCLLGNYCPSDNPSPRKCPVGYVNYYESTLRSSCRSCPLGSFNNITGGINDGSYWDCKNCPLGYSCSSPDDPPKKCPAGSVNYNVLHHRYSCLRCPLGYYRTQEAGINDGSVWECLPCPLGHFCSSPDKEPQICPPGTTNFINIHERTACRKCSVGYYNIKTGGVHTGSYSDCKLCPSGYFCPTTNECPKKCPDGTKSATGSWSSDNCGSCVDCYVFPHKC